MDLPLSVVEGGVVVGTGVVAGEVRRGEEGADTGEEEADMAGVEEEEAMEEEAAVLTDTGAVYQSCSLLSLLA